MSEKAIRIWNGNKVVAVITVNQAGTFSSLRAIGAAANSTLVDIEIDPWAGMIVDHDTDNPPLNWREAGRDEDENEEGPAVKFASGKLLTAKDVNEEPRRDAPGLSVGDKVVRRGTHGGKVLTVAQVTRTLDNDPVQQQFRSEDSNLWRRSDLFKVVPRSKNP